jgi:hypothetical protein
MQVHGLAGRAGGLASQLAAHRARGLDTSGGHAQVGDRRIRRVITFPDPSDVPPPGHEELVDPATGQPRARRMLSITLMVTDREKIAALNSLHSKHVEGGFGERTVKPGGDRDRDRPRGVGFGGGGGGAAWLYVCVVAARGRLSCSGFKGHSLIACVIV